MSLHLLCVLDIHRDINFSGIMFIMNCCLYVVKKSNVDISGEWLVNIVFGAFLCRVLIIFSKVDFACQLYFFHC